jgi:hypothetical protein
MEASEIETAAWWKNQRTNFVYVAMAAGILCFLAFTAIWETFYGKAERGTPGLVVIGGILLSMVQHLLIWVPFLWLEIYAFKLLPKLDARFNPRGQMDTRRQILIVGCVAACFIPLLLPTILVWVHG